VKQFPDMNKLFNVVSCWIYEYIGILLGAHPTFHISRIRVKVVALLFDSNSADLHICVSCVLLEWEYFGDNSFYIHERSLSELLL
jgi:hypothetical protein